MLPSDEQAQGWAVSLQDPRCYFLDRQWPVRVALQHFAGQFLAVAAPVLSKCQYSGMPRAAYSSRFTPVSLLAVLG